MKTLALLMLSSLSWNNVDPEGQVFALTEKVTLGDPYFPTGTELRLLEREPLTFPGANLMLYRLTQEPCAHPEWSSEMQIITPAGNQESSAVGVELGRGCQWSIYVEQKDLATSSFFRQVN
jgi:hypothetical protein